MSAATEQLRSKQNTGAEPETILIVDGEFLNRWMSQTVLTHNGYCALEATNVDEAVTVSANRKAPIHALLIDVAIAGPHAAETVALIRQGRPELKPIFMANALDIDRARELCLLPLLRKPFGVRTLLTMVRGVLDAD